MTTEPKHWILRDEHGCVLGAAVIRPHYLTEESAWEALAGDKRTPGMRLEKITDEQWDTEYGDRFGPCTGPVSPVAAVPAPVQGADPTGPQETAERELELLREDNEMAEVMLRIERRNVNRWEQKHNAQRERADKAEAALAAATRVPTDLIEEALDAFVEASHGIPRSKWPPRT